MSSVARERLVETNFWCCATEIVQRFDSHSGNPDVCIYFRGKNQR